MIYYKGQMHFSAYTFQYFSNMEGECCISPALVFFENPHHVWKVLELGKFNEFFF